MNSRHSSIQEINKAFSSMFNKLWDTTKSSTLMEDKLIIQVKTNLPESWFSDVINIINELKNKGIIDKNYKLTREMLISSSKENLTFSIPIGEMKGIEVKSQPKTIIPTEVKLEKSPIKENVTLTIPLEYVKKNEPSSPLLRSSILSSTLPKENKSLEKKEWLPNIIFGELHNKPITREILTKLIPELKKLGYRHFFDEMIEGVSLQLNLNDVIRTIETCHPDQKTALEAEKDFLIALSEHKIEYKPIDCARNLDKCNDPSSAFDKARDEEMASAYLKTTKPVFGRNGIGHHSSIQRNILKVLPLDIAKQQFIFFQIFTMPKTNDPLEHMLGGGFTGFNILGNNEYPLGLVKIDATDMSIDDVIKIILKKLKNSAHNKDAATLMSSSNPEQLSTRISEPSHIQIIPEQSTVIVSTSDTSTPTNHLTDQQQQLEQKKLKEEKQNIAVAVGEMEKNKPELIGLISKKFLTDVSQPVEKSAINQLSFMDKFISFILEAIGFKSNPYSFFSTINSPEAIGVIADQSCNSFDISKNRKW